MRLLENFPDGFRTSFMVLWLRRLRSRPQFTLTGYPAAARVLSAISSSLGAAGLLFYLRFLSLPPERYCGFELNSSRYMYCRLVVFSPTCHASVLTSTRPFRPFFLPRWLTFVGCKAGRQSRGATFGSGHCRMGPNGHFNISDLSSSSFSFRCGSAGGHCTLVNALAARNY